MSVLEIRAIVLEKTSHFLMGAPLLKIIPMWFLHVGTPSNFSLVSRDFLAATCGDSWIDRGKTHVWPARFPNLPSGSFLMDISEVFNSRYSRENFGPLAKLDDCWVYLNSKRSWCVCVFAPGLEEIISNIYCKLSKFSCFL